MKETKPMEDKITRAHSRKIGNLSEQSCIHAVNLMCSLKPPHKENKHQVHTTSLVNYTKHLRKKYHLGYVF